MSQGPWLILRVRTRSERTERERLNEIGIPATYPVISRTFKRTHRKGSQRKRQTHTQKWPLISGFLFVPAEGSIEEDMALIRRCCKGPRCMTRGYVAKMLDTTGAMPPYRLPDAEMQRMLDNAGNLGVKRSLGQVDVGGFAKVMEGYLEGFTLEIVELGEKTGKVKFTIFGRETKAEVKREDLLPVED